MIAAPDFAHWARQWRGPMLRFARLHLQPREEAEDAVQDALAALLAADPETLRLTDPKRYLFGILRNKITDRLRRKYRPEVGYGEAFDDDIDTLLFDKRDHWIAGMAPSAWSTPDSQLESEQFFAVVDICIQKLPAKPARVFSMKEFLECDPEEICATLGITKADYWQCMSRARKQVQMCLNQTWFEGATR
jgi:RNA polymerase sigma-70 factor (ECF subfamily)